MTILVKLAMLTLVVVVAFIVFFMFSRSTFAHLSESIRDMQATNSALTQIAKQQSTLAYEAQVSLYKAINYGAQHYSRAETSALVELVKASLKSGVAMSKDMATFPGLSEDEVSAALAAQAAFDEYYKYARNALGFILDDPALALSAMPEVESTFSTVSSSLSMLDLTIATATSRSFDTVQAEADRLVGVLLAVGLAAIAIVVGFSVVIVRSITVPIKTLVRVLGIAGTGDFMVSTQLAGNDEMGRMGSGIDELIKEMRSLIGTVKEKVAALEKTGRDLSANMEETASAVIQINSNISSTKGQLAEQSDSVGEVSAAMEQLARGVESLSSLISTQSQVVVQSSASVEQMIANVESVAQSSATAAAASDELVGASTEGKQRIDQVGDSVRDIVHDSEALNEAADVIAQIASRTNLLAMNAAIEAAHAGDSGRGFAVVADEIRKLAEQSTEQAKDISAGLGKVAAAIGTVRIAADYAVDAFGTVLSRSESLGGEVRRISASMSEQREGGRQLLEGLSRLKDITGQIAAGSDEMTGGNGAILTQISRLNAVNGSVVRNNDEINTGTREINEAIMATTELSSRTAELIADVKEAADRFAV
jgi:methyl-accepting chemotaxis protein